MGNQAAFSPEFGPVDSERVLEWFSDPVAVDHYARAAYSLGLWKSEEIVFRSIFKPRDRLLDAGCGAGRVALGLWRLGYTRVTGIDFCESLIVAARGIAADLQAAVQLDVGDARALPFEEGTYDGAIFAFNGLMQIPAREDRRKVLRELRRVIVPGGFFVFTTHDLERIRHRQDRGIGEKGIGQKVTEAGIDRVMQLPEGNVFMHIPARIEILDDLALAGWEHVEDHSRNGIANESQAVREFADECRFWIARRPDAE